MFEIKIRRPKTEDIEGLKEFFKEVITHTFIKEGVGDRTEDINEEIKTKEKYLKSDLDSNGGERYFLIAFHDNKVIATIEYGTPNELINSCTKGSLKNIPEIGTVFVKPDFQGQGIGSLMIKKILIAIEEKGIMEFCLDSGYPTAQMIWLKKFGQADYILKDYWGEGMDHMIWIRALKDIQCSHCSKVK